MAITIDSLLAALVENDASDLHLKSGQPPVMRIRGELQRFPQYSMLPSEHDHMLLGMLNEERLERLEEQKEVDLSYNLPGVSRFRVNMFWQRGHIGAVMRVIPHRIRTIAELGMPTVCERISLLPRGLILVTGPTGSGKSTSLAAMIDHINSHKRAHVMTIEDPIEYVHKDKTSIVNQRELATDTHSFSEALRHVMRQNPDVILVGEMRDLETIQLAITAAETGHLVLSTLHTVDAAQTMDRIVDVFTPEQQAQVRTQLSSTIQAVISQTLIPTLDGTGRTAAYEVMVATSAIRTLIRDGKTHSLYMDIQTGADLGMQTLDGCLLRLVKERKIDYEHALAKCSNAQEFVRRAANMGLVEVQPSAVR
ncbi:type IV pilus twitching motility protein PilT [Fimbriimonas ginsengisoli]|uniref:Putative twitching motility protein n=1 Tax=Fimbriimonas ginsengisoli Gsoil 348 TaxID=661478 RepID=A0A068NPA4_FIMGI|nr:type IV pilus twitching motility protein PilT [Fimbriimonas ginsengisoli]AIE83419.1 putative twitching motility protein [Fimbriimonas ginsengisoli Gsoil 348]